MLTRRPDGWAVSRQFTTCQEERRRSKPGVSFCYQLTHMTILLSVLAALSLGSGVALQHRVAVTVPAQYAGKPGLLARVVRRPLWWLGFAGDICGFGLQAAALSQGSLVVVQPILTTSLVVSLALTSAASHRAITRIEWASILLLLAGLCLFIVSAAPSDSTVTPEVAAWIVTIVSVGVLSGVALGTGLRATGAHRAAMLAIAAGLADALLAVFVKAFATSFDGRGVLGVLGTWTPYAAMIAGIATVLLIQSAYQAGHPTVALPIITALNPLVASVIGILLYGESLRLSVATAPIVFLAIGAMTMGLIVLTRQESTAATI